MKTFDRCFSEAVDDLRGIFRFDGLIVGPFWKDRDEWCRGTQTETSDSFDKDFVLESPALDLVAKGLQHPIAS
jgi:hypothetical protein